MSAELNFQYCLRLVVPTVGYGYSSDPNKFSLELSCASIPSNKQSLVKDGITVEQASKIKNKTSQDVLEFEFKVYFSIFSHAFNNAPFNLLIRDETGKVIYQSKEVYLYARRNRQKKRKREVFDDDDDDDSIDDEEPMYKRRK
jgi:hypothetical protein